jgi:hypothetical protein
MIGEKDKMLLLIIHHLKESWRIRCLQIVEWLKNKKALNELDKKKRNKVFRRFFQSGVSNTDDNPLFLCCNAVMLLLNFLTLAITGCLN